MSAAAYIRFYAPYSDDLLPYLEYSGHVYAKCKNEHFVAGSLFRVLGRWASVELADIFGCKLNDASTWNITDFDDSNCTLSGGLYALLCEDVSHEIETLEALLKTPGARVFFDPNS